MKLRSVAVWMNSLTPLRRFLGVLLVAAITLLLATQSATVACPFCAAPSLTLAEQFDKAEVVVLVEWSSAKKSDEKQLGSTRYKIVEVSKPAPAKKTPGAKASKFAENPIGQPATLPGVSATPVKALKKGKEIDVKLYRQGAPGELTVLFGTMLTTDQVEWSSPLLVSKEAYQYISKSPALDVANEERLAYFVQYLDSTDELISNDAYQEFANAPYSDIKLIADKMPREKLRKWVTEGSPSTGRLGLYGLMLGLCGDDEDAAAMEKLISIPSRDFRLGIDGVMSGYLIIRGEKGLDLLDRVKIDDTKTQFSEIYAVRNAINFMVTSEAERISKKRLSASLRKFLQPHTTMEDLAITDLARVKDWGVQPTLMKLYHTEAFTEPSKRRAIIRFMLAAQLDHPEGEENEPAHVTSANKNLEELEAIDPVLVAEARKLFKNY